MGSAPAPASVGPPANDNFENATTVGHVPFSDRVETTLATTQPDEPTSCHDFDPIDSHTVWYRYTADHDTTILIDTIGTDFRDTSIAIYTGSSLSTLTSIKCALTFSFNRVDLPVTAGTTYFIQVGSGNIDGFGRLQVNINFAGTISGLVTDLSGRPANFVCISVIDSTGNTVWRTRSEPGAGHPDGYYHLGPLPAPGSYRLQAADGYCGNQDFVSQWYSNKSSPSQADAVLVNPNTETSSVDFALTHKPAIAGLVTTTSGAPIAGMCVYIYGLKQGGQYTFTDADGHFLTYLQGPSQYKVLFNCSDPSHSWEWYNGKSSFETADVVSVGGPGSVTTVNATLESYAAPANDAFASAQVISTDDFSDTERLSLATTEKHEPTACGGARTVWYSYTPPTSRTIELDAAGAHMAPFVAVYTGTDLSNLSQIGCINYARQTPSNASAALFLKLDAGVTYHFQVGDFNWGVVTFHMARAETSEILYDKATTPCAVACPYWTGGVTASMQNEAACQPSPLAPPGSWQDENVTMPATLSNGRPPAFLSFHIAPSIDYDFFICRAASDSEGHYYVANGADPIGSTTCDTVTIGCEETSVIKVAPGDRYVLRMYNWVDVNPITADYAIAG